MTARSPSGHERLLSLPRFAVSGADAMKPGLERIHALLDRLGHPERACPVVHVAGTNGKGSTASMIAAALTASGYRTGLHTSPHLVKVGERMRVDGVPAPDEWVDQAVDGLWDDVETISPSYFEVTVALAFRYFEEQRTDVSVVEVGLGGRLDATNVVLPEVAVITRIALDHADILGPALTDIAREKGGIAKPGVPLVAADSGEDVTAVLAGIARRLPCPLEIVGPRPEAVELDLEGAHQQHNASLALAALARLQASGRFPDLTDQTIGQGLRQVVRYTGLRARFETVGHRPRVVVDAAHNPDGLRQALSCMADDAGRFFVLFGAMRDKDVPGMAALLAASKAVVLPVTLPGDRAFDAGTLAGHLAGAGCRVGPTLGTPDDAVRWIRSAAAPSDRILVAGSFLLVGPFLSAWEAA